MQVSRLIVLDDPYSYTIEKWCKEYYPVNKTVTCSFPASGGKEKINADVEADGLGMTGLTVILCTDTGGQIKADNVTFDR